MNMKILADFQICISVPLMFRNNLLRKYTVGESGAPSLLQKEKRRPAKSEVSKVLFPDIGKITNRGCSNFCVSQ